MPRLGYTGLDGTETDHNLENFIRGSVLTMPDNFDGKVITVTARFDTTSVSHEVQALVYKKLNDTTYDFLGKSIGTTEVLVGTTTVDFNFTVDSVSLLAGETYLIAVWALAAAGGCRLTYVADTTFISVADANTYNNSTPIDPLVITGTSDFRDDIFVIYSTKPNIGTKGTSEILTDFPTESGLEVGDKHDGRVTNLVAELPSHVRERERVGLKD